MYLFQEAINLLEPMTNDPVNYVRQGALISSALIMIQQTEVTCPKVSEGFLSPVQFTAQVVWWFYMLTIPFNFLHIQAALLWFLHSSHTALSFCRPLI